MKLIATKKLLIAATILLSIGFTSCGGNSSTETEQNKVDSAVTDTILQDPMDTGDTRGVKTPVKN